MTDQGDAAGTRVLVVDDEQSITDLVAMALRYERFDVHVAHGGREALDAVESFDPDLVVLDVMMPGIITSSTSRSGSKVSTASSASRPPCATWTVNCS